MYSICFYLVRCFPQILTTDQLQDMARVSLYFSIRWKHGIDLYPFPQIAQGQGCYDAQLGRTVQEAKKNYDGQGIVLPGAGAGSEHLTTKNGDFRKNKTWDLDILDGGFKSLSDLTIISHLHLWV